MNTQTSHDGMDDMLEASGRVNSKVEALQKAAQRLDALDKLAAFGAAMLDHSRTEMGDIDGFDLEAMALKHGVLESRFAQEPCGDPCICGEIIGFPTECHFIPSNVAEASRELLKPKLKSNVPMQPL